MTGDSLIIAAAIFGLLAAAGSAVDMWLLKTEKSKIHLAMMNWWIKLYETPIPDIPRKVARLAYRALSIFFTTKNLSRSFIVFLIFSTALTLYATNFFYFFYDTVPGIGHLRRDASYPHWPHWTIYATNIVFDAASLLVTLHALHVISSKKSRIAYLWFVADFFAAFILMALCITSTFEAEAQSITRDMYGCNQDKLEATWVWDNGPGREPDILEEDFGNYLRSQPNIEFKVYNHYWLNAVRAPIYAWAAMSGSGEAEITYTYSIYWRSIAGALLYKWEGKHTIQASEYLLYPPLTVALPTALILLSVLLTAVIRIALSMSRYLSLRFLERATEINPDSDPSLFMPGTLIGATLGVLACIVQLIISLLSN